MTGFYNWAEDPDVVAALAAPEPADPYLMAGRVRDMFDPTERGAR